MWIITHKNLQAAKVLLTTYKVELLLLVDVVIRYLHWPLIEGC
jgi:hypothetical protein